MFNKKIKESESLHKELTNPDNILSIDVEKEVLSELLNVFLLTKLSKTDLKVLMVLFSEFWDQKTSKIITPNLDSLIHIGKLEMSIPNVSRSLKALVDNQVITKISDAKRVSKTSTLTATEYFFNTAFEVLKTKNSYY